MRRSSPGYMRMGRALLFLPSTAVLIAAAPPVAGAWQPGPTRYEVGKQSNVPVTMSDGTVLRANIHYPTDPSTGQAAKGPFPVIMVQTPYGKDTSWVRERAGGRRGGRFPGRSDPLPDQARLHRRGRRGARHRRLGGQLRPARPHPGPRRCRAGALGGQAPHSNGNVGLYGPSYMGLDQFMTANAIGPHSPLKAMFPIVAGNDTYRDAREQPSLELWNCDGPSVPSQLRAHVTPVSE